MIGSIIGAGVAWARERLGEGDELPTALTPETTGSVMEHSRAVNQEVDRKPGEALDDGLPLKRVPARLDPIAQTARMHFGFCWLCCHGQAQQGGMRLCVECATDRLGEARREWARLHAERAAQRI